jgi:hypothetical protein
MVVVVGSLSCRRLTSAFPFVSLIRSLSSLSYSSLLPPLPLVSHTPSLMDFFRFSPFCNFYFVFRQRLRFDGER